MMPRPAPYQTNWSLSFHYYEPTMRTQPQQLCFVVSTLYLSTVWKPWGASHSALSDVKNVTPSSAQLFFSYFSTIPQDETRGHWVESRIWWWQLMKYSKLAFHPRPLWVPVWVDCALCPYWYTYLRKSLYIPRNITHKYMRKHQSRDAQCSSPATYKES